MYGKNSNGSSQVVRLAAWPEIRTGVRRLSCLTPEGTSASSPKGLAFGPSA